MDLPASLLEVVTSTRHKEPAGLRWQSDPRWSSDPTWRICILFVADQQNQCAFLSYFATPKQWTLSFDGSFVFLFKTAPGRRWSELLLLSFSSLFCLVFVICLCLLFVLICVTSLLFDQEITFSWATSPAWPELQSQNQDQDFLEFLLCNPKM